MEGLFQIGHLSWDILPNVIKILFYIPQGFFLKFLCAWVNRTLYKKQIIFLNLLIDVASTSGT